MFRRENLNYVVISIVFDISGLLFALHLAQLLHPILSPKMPNNVPTQLPWFVSYLALAIWLGIAIALSVYDARRNFRAVDEFQRVFVAGLFAHLHMHNPLVIVVVVILTSVLFALGGLINAI